MIHSRSWNEKALSVEGGRGSSGFDLIKTCPLDISQDLAFMSGLRQHSTFLFGTWSSTRTGLIGECGYDQGGLGVMSVMV